MIKTQRYYIVLGLEYCLIETNLSFKFFNHFLLNCWKICICYVCICKCTHVCMCTGRRVRVLIGTCRGCLEEINYIKHIGELQFA